MDTILDVKALRNDLGESQEAFGKRFGVTQTAVLRWEKGGAPKRGLVAEALKKLRSKTPAMERAS
jgi:transcriptional regulator with XRE-family HTH domain